MDRRACVALVGATVSENDGGCAMREREIHVDVEKLLDEPKVDEHGAIARGGAAKADTHRNTRALECRHARSCVEIEASEHERRRAGR